MNQSLPAPLSLHLLLQACVLCMRDYPNISLFFRQETRDPFFFEAFRKSSRVIMAHYLMVRVYLGFHYFHCPLETRKNISPTAVRVLFTSDHKRSAAVPARTLSQQSCCFVPSTILVNTILYSFQDISQLFVYKSGL